MTPIPARAPRRARPRPARERARLAILAVVIVGLAGTARSAEAMPRPVAQPAAAAIPAPGAPLPEASFAHRLSAEVYGFLPYWEIDSGTDGYLQYDLLTDIALFSVGFTASGAIDPAGTGYPSVTGSTAATIVDHAHAAGVRVDLTVTSFGFDKNAAFFADPTAMATAASAISGLVQAEGLDGVNLDVELLNNDDFAAYGAFVGQLRTALRAWNPAARVSVATNGSLSGAGMAIQALANGADRVFIMGYAYRTAGSSPVGSISPIVRADGDKSLTWTLDLYASKGIAADRLLLGLPYYGRSWPTTSGALNAAATGSGGLFIPSDDMAAIPPGTVIQHDTLEGAKWFAVQDAGGAWTQTYFDDPTTLRAKYAVANGRGLAGVGIWALGYDRGIAGYWDAIATSFGTFRVAGSDRYATAAAISAGWAPGVPVVYVATGLNFPDALAGAAAAGSLGAPLLLTMTDTVPAATVAELQRLKPGRIVILGGPGVVSDNVVGTLSYYTSGGVFRLSGSDRYATAAAISAGWAPGVPVVYVATGLNFPDALAGAAAAGSLGAPLLLVTGTTVPAATAAELARLKPGRIVILGGTGAVSDSVAAAVFAAAGG